MDRCDVGLARAEVRDDRIDLGNDLPRMLGGVGSTLSARNTTAILSFACRGIEASIPPFDAVRPQADGVEFSVPAKGSVCRELRKIRQDGGRTSDAIDAFWRLLGR